MCCAAVIRELDYLQRHGESKARSTVALEWIKGCMSETRPWIHVQSSAEIVHVAQLTPPVSPSVYSMYMALILPCKDIHHCEVVTSCDFSCGNNLKLL